MRALASLLAPLALALPLAANQLHVPGDFADIQSAIDAAQDGDVIVIHGGTHPPITIDKSLTLIGDPAPLILADTLATVTGDYRGPITLEGPGSGRVTLGRIETGGVTEGQIFGNSAPGVSGDGFSSLVVFDSIVRAPSWVFLTGIAFGEPGIDVDVDYVYVERSTIEASASDTDDCYFFGPDGVPGLNAPGTVALFDSTVTGGSASVSYYCLPAPFCDCPPGGLGGPGVVAQAVLRAGNTLSGGAGVQWEDAYGNVCCTKSDGAPLQVAQDTVLPNDVAGSGPFDFGQPYTLDPSAAPTSSVLFLISKGVGTPVEFPGLGWSFLNFGIFNTVGVFGPAPATFPLGANPILIGKELVAQYFDLTNLRFLRPVSGVLLP